DPGLVQATTAADQDSSALVPVEPKEMAFAPEMRVDASFEGVMPAASPATPGEPAAHTFEQSIADHVLVRPPWYVRPAFRMLRIPLAMIVLGAVLSVIPYPRYVTDECNVLPLTRSEVRAEVDGILTSIPFDE